jgi:TPR repeat protein
MYTHGRTGFPQDFKRAFPLLEAAAASQHAPATYMIGVYKTYGHGVSIDYYNAINWFERAAGMGDSRVAARASSAARELETLIEEAHKVNEDIIDRYKVMNAGREDGDEDEEDMLDQPI